jgi:sulfhydrogenase subunit delta
MKPKVGIFALSGCWGEQIVILNCEDELLTVAAAVDLVDFRGGSSRVDDAAPLDLALVEGSVGSCHEEAALRRIRDRARLLVACGSCAAFGGISAMDGDRPRDATSTLVYGPGARYDFHPHRPLSDYVTVDYAIPGCPMEKRDFLRALTALLNGDLPEAPVYPVCTECRVAEQECLLLARKVPCAGPVTTAGCGARCPSHGVPCIGCRGPVSEANLASMREVLAAAGVSEDDIRRKLRTFAAPVLGDLGGRA